MPLSTSKQRPEHGAFVPANTLNSMTEPNLPLRPTSGNSQQSLFDTSQTHKMDKKTLQSSNNAAQKPKSTASGDMGALYGAGGGSGWNSVPNSRAMNLHANAGGSLNDIMSDYDSRPRTRPEFKVPTLPGQPSQPVPHQPMQAMGGGIMRPTNVAPPTIPAAPRPMYATNPGGFVPVNAQWATGKGQRLPVNDFIDLTRESSAQPSQSRSTDEDDGFDPNKIPGSNRYDAYDPMNYMDSAQASENIQKLLEGAFEEDDEDKPKSRLRRRKQPRVNEDTAADRLAAKLQQVDLKKEEESTEKPDEDEEDDGSLDGLNIKLLPHQIDGVSWMLDKEIGERKRNGVLPKGGILADDMGLGKTVQAISLILSNPRPSSEWIEANPKKKFPKAAGKGTLVVAPLALIKQWEAEIRDKVTKDQKLKVLVHHGQSRTKHFEDLKKYDIVITTYQTLTSENDGSSPDDNGIKVGCFGVHWYRVILDEAHSIKNRNAKMTKAAYNLKSVYRWCLSGTPMQNNLDELQSLIRFLQIKPYMDIRVWKEQIGMPMKNGRGGLAMKRLQYFLKAFMKRRTKDVLKQSGALKFGKAGAAKEGEDGEDKRDGFKIVARTVQTVETDFSEKERAHYDRLQQRTEKSLDAMMGEKKDYIGALVLLLRLRQLCNHPDLIKANLKDKENIPAPNGKASQRGKDDVDDIADMLGGLSVENKKCDVCQTVLSQNEMASGKLHCSECETDIQGNDESSLMEAVTTKSKPRKLKRGKAKLSEASAVDDEDVESERPSDGQSSRRQRKVVDSDDEDEEDDEKGEWLVQPSEQQSLHMGKAGGQEDEDAEGGGDWIQSDDERSVDEAEPGEGEEDSFVSHDTEASNRKYYSSSESEDDEIPAPTVRKIAGPMASTKIKHLLGILEQETPEHKTIVFSEFTSMLDLIQPHLHAANIRFVRYDGKMANPEREASLHALRTDRRVRVLLCSLRCGSLGLNLTAASRVVLMEPFWNPFVEEQAIDRVHRLNQTRDVVVFRLTVRGTVEERILALQERKRELARAAIEGGGAAGAKGKMNLGMADVLALFRRDARDYGDPEVSALGAGNVRVLQAGVGSTTTVGSSAPGEQHKGRVVSVPGGTAKSKSQFDSAYGRRW